MSVTPPKLQWPQDNTALSKVIKEKPFGELPLAAQQNAVGLALIEGWLTPDQKTSEIVSALKKGFGPLFPDEVHLSKAGTKCDLLLTVKEMAVPTIASWKLEEILSEVSVKLSADAFSAPLCAVWNGKPETGTATAKMQDVQVNLMLLLLTYSEEKEQSVDATRARRVIRLVKTLLEEWKGLSPSGADKKTLENIGSVLAFIREKGLEAKEGITGKSTEDLKERIAYCKLKIALLLEEKTQVPLTPPMPAQAPPKKKPQAPPKKKPQAPPKKPQAPPKEEPENPPADTQPGRSNLYPLLAVVGLLAVGGLAYKAWADGSLTLPSWLTWNGATQAKRVTTGR